MQSWSTVVMPNGRTLRVNIFLYLNPLIQEIVVDPSAPDWLLDLVSSVAERYNLQVPINKSHLAALPTWFPPDRIDEVLPQEDE